MAGRQFEVRDIVAYKQLHRQDYYLVAWKDYGDEHNSWEPRKSIIAPDDANLAKMKLLKTRAKEKNGRTDGEDELQQRQQLPPKRSETDDHKQTDGRNGVTVKKLKIIEKKIAVHAVGEGLPPAGEEVFTPLVEFRYGHPQPLITYLIKIMRFVENNKKT
eukprot:GHVS01043510.1.p1 GENE.GHVS01043510.1~~GHVS01043510.1.p1  ORF type:complete len:179 (-),score=43.64 GHVS01043510.1:11-490(-)